VKSRTSTSIFIAAMTLFAALATAVQLAIPAGATSEKDTEGLLAGLWHGVISSPDNSFPSFQTFEQYGEGTWTGSGQPDLTPPVASNAVGHLAPQSG
jgi:hypothetical protein